MNMFQSLFGGAAAGLKEIIEQGAYLVDVRTPGEFMSGHVKGSVNIPLDSVSTHFSKFKNKNNIIVFCHSGSRSEQAKMILQRNGITNVINGGAREDVNQFVQ